MTLGDKQPAKFEKGQALTAAAMNRLVDAVVAQIRRMFGASVLTPDPLILKVTSQADAASNAETGQTTGTGTVMQIESDGSIVPTPRSIVFTNRQQAAVVIDDIIKVGWFGNRWELLNGSGTASIIRFEIYEADCEARSAVGRILSSGGSVPGSYEIYGETETNEAGETINSRFVAVYDKAGCYLNESNINLLNRIGYATYLTGRPKYTYQPWTCFEITALAEQQTECEAF